MTESLDRRTATQDRQRAVGEALRALGAPRAAHRVPSPLGRLDADEQVFGRLRATLAALGPVFLDFGRYLLSRTDLLSRRDCLELAEGHAEGAGHDRRPPAPAAEIDRLVSEQLGLPPDRLFAGVRTGAARPDPVGATARRAASVGRAGVRDHRQA